MAVRSGPDSPSQPTRVDVPKLVTDPLASICASEIEVRIAAIRCVVPAMMAADWLPILMTGSQLALDDVLPGLLDEDTAALVEDALFDGILGLDQMYETALEIVSVAGGRPWWVALRLIETARASWDTMGPALIMAGVRADQVTLSAWLDAVMGQCVKALYSMKQGEVNLWLMNLEKAPEGAEREEASISMDQFMSMM